MICSNQRPVSIADLRAFQMRHDLCQTKVAIWLGCKVKDLSSYRKLDRLRPGMLIHHYYALTLRWLDLYPEEARIGLAIVQPHALHTRLSRVIAPERLIWKRFALYLGREGSAGYRWAEGRPGAPSVLRACALLHRDDDAAQRDAWRRWQDIARLEARLRGLPDLDRASTWPSCRLPRAPAIPSLDIAESEEHIRRPSRKERHTCA